METVEGFLAQRLDELLDAIADERPAPAGGSVAALVTAMAAGLVAMAARLSSEWDRAEDVLARAEALRRHVTPLAPGDAAAYEEVLTAMRLPKDLEPDVRNRTIANALARAAEIPLEIAADAAETAELGALAAERGNPNLRGDAVAGTLFAAAAARAAANLVEINLGTTEGDERVAAARRHVVVAAAAAERALASGP